MAKICLVRPPMIMPISAMTTSQGVPSIGMAYLTACLKEAGHQVEVVDAFGEATEQFTRIQGTPLLANGLRADEIVERVPKDLDLLGVSCMFSNEWLYSRICIQELGAAFRGVPLIGGGEHFTADPEYSLRRCPELTAVVLGEGEETLVDLVDAITGGRQLDGVAGIAYLDGDRLVKTPPRARIRNIDEIPRPSWDEVPLENYLAGGFGMNAVKGRNMPMIATRGCPYECTFCSNPAMWTRRWVARDPRAVLQEIRHWVERHRVEHVEFYDLTAVVKRDWIIEFSKLLIEAELGITWSLPSGTRSEALDEEVVILLKRSGCHSLTYAPESGSAATLKRIKKQVKLPRMLSSMRASAKAGISIKANFIIGLPGQTLKEVFETYVFLIKIAWAGVNDAAVFPFVPYPGSALFYGLVNDGRIPKDSKTYEAFLSGNVYNEVSGMLSWSEHISHRQVKLLTVGGMIWFYGWQFLFRPWRVFGSAWRLVRGKPYTMLERLVHGVTRNFLTSRRKLAAALDSRPQGVPAHPYEPAP